MKKLALPLIGAMLVVMMTSCFKSTTYEVYNGTSDISLYDVKAYEYAGSNAVSFHDLGFLASNSTSGRIEANKETKQVRVAFKLATGGDVYTTADYYNITQGSHTVILIEDNTQIIDGSDKGTTTVADMLK